MFELLTDPGFYAALFGVTLIQVALGADNLIIITIIANKLPEEKRKKAVNLGLLIAMALRILLLLCVSAILKYMTKPFWEFDATVLGLHAHGEVSGKSIVLLVGGLVLIWKGIKELRAKAKKLEQEVQQAESFKEVVAVIVGLNLLFSVDSILTVVGMTDVFAVMVLSVLISVGAMLAFAGKISDFISQNPDFEILGLFVLLLIGFVLILEGGHVAHLTVNESKFPYIPHWILIFILLLMFSVDLYQNWLERKQETAPVKLHHRVK